MEKPGRAKVCASVLLPSTSSLTLQHNRECSSRPDSDDSTGKTDMEVSLLENKGDEHESQTRENSADDDEDDNDEDEIFARNLNAIILQYLESCGLTETYTTFYDECKSSGMLIPSHYKAEIERGISLQDVETLLMHFDQENGGALLELWEVLIGVVDASQHYKEVEKITFYIQVYIALIPFRQKMSEGRKNGSMKKLREYFETKSEACTIDNEMSSLFALPFVPDPETHPVFGNLFQVAWIKKLRSRIKNLARALCSPNKLITRDQTDLAKMYKSCSNAIPHEVESSDGKKICILSNAEPVEFTSGAELLPSASRQKLESSRNKKDDFSPTLFFQRMNDLILENERYKKEERTYEKQCAQLLNVSLLLANSLEEAAQGKEINMDKLRHEINDCLPLSMRKTEESIAPNCQIIVSQSSRLSTGNTSSDSDTSNNMLVRFEGEHNTDTKARGNLNKRHERGNVTDSG